MRLRNGRDDGIVIVGGGLAGQRCAEALRRYDYDGPVRIVCGEPHRPYDRPPLSKELLAGFGDEQSIAFREARWYERESIDLLLGMQATALRIPERRIELSDGGSLRYRHLVIATGSRPRALSMLEGYDNVSVLRGLEDCLALREILRGSPRLAVIGAGFIGQEVAATARRLGVSVTMIEAAPAPLVSILGPEIGDWFTRLHIAEGVKVLCNCTVVRAIGNGRIDRLRLSDGQSVDTDHVVVGVGVEPNIGWLERTPLTRAGGIPVDPNGRTALAEVMAIGDAASTFDAVAVRHVPGSHWEAASRQAARAARVLLGLDPGETQLTSFWTDQYGIRIQYLGHAWLADRVELEGEPGERRFTARFLRRGRTVGALAVNRPRALPTLRKLIEKGAT